MLRTWQVRWLILVLSAGTAAAQPAAQDPPPAHPGHHPPSGLGGDLAFGFSGQIGGDTAYVARFEYELLPVLAPTHQRGGVAGLMLGFDYWRAGTDNAGVAMPVLWVGGIRVFPIRALVGFGFEGILIDQVADDTGFGWLAPLAMLRAGLDIHGYQLGIDTRVDYRWQFGAPDHGRWQVALFIGRTIESNPPLY